MIEDDQDEMDFQLWNELEGAPLDQLHQELKSNDRDRRYAAARLLHSRGDSSTFNFALEMAKSTSPACREIAAFLMGQLPELDFSSRNTFIEVLATMLTGDSDNLVKSSSASALGHLRAVEKLKELINAANDNDTRVRENVAFAAGKIDTPEAIKLLIGLSYDQDIAVVEWATLGLTNSSHTATSIVADRLTELASHSNREIRETAIAALANTGNKNIMPSLLRALEEDEVNFSIIDAAGQLGDRRALPLLLDLARNCRGDIPNVLLNSISKLGGAD
ncbi:HEAT repeat domain-containing protein [Xanthomonas sp. fls2-241-TYG-148]|uniref:HEAT repeat domain-containing protein n=1 Tax=Xanthomonas sp. fls2-241-TYG-148 TaxID=3040328 RepID=UPI002554D975|nr:HEAT repeat domain-containing protein [Xanthomonas sp. fls2-241-TYG-148]